MYIFTNSFKKSAEIIANELGLIDATSERQKKNGTISYVDPVTGVYYSLHTTGYVRRKTYVNHYGTVRAQHYQLNPQRKLNRGEWPQSVIRVALSPMEQLSKLTTSVILYRKNNSIKP